MRRVAPPREVCVGDRVKLKMPPGVECGRYERVRGTVVRLTSPDGGVEVAWDPEHVSAGLDAALIVEARVVLAEDSP